MCVHFNIIHQEHNTKYVGFCALVLLYIWSRKPQYVNPSRSVQPPVESHRCECILYRADADPGWTPHRTRDRGGEWMINISLWSHMMRARVQCKPARRATRNLHEQTPCDGRTPCSRIRLLCECVHGFLFNWIYIHTANAAVHPEHRAKCVYRYGTSAQVNASPKPPLRQAIYQVWRRLQKGSFYPNGRRRQQIQIPLPYIITRAAKS